MADNCCVWNVSNQHAPSATNAGVIIWLFDSVPSDP